MLIIPTTENQDIDRTDAFRQYTKQWATGAVVVPPRLLLPNERRQYVRQTLREDHRHRIANRPEGAQDKFDALAASVMTFFRGTALLYYRDYAGEDGDLPVVFTVGDIHPENFGVMPNEDGAPFFGINDFDEAYFAPFTYDIKRGVTGFYLVAYEKGFNKAARMAVARAFVNGYVEGLQEFARNDREKWHQYRIDNSPPMIQALIKSTLGQRAHFLEKWVDLEHDRFVPSKKIVPYSQAIEKFAKIVKQYVKDNQVKVPGKNANFFDVKDVAVRKGSGTASLGLDRYFVLIEGVSPDPADNVILEFKQTRRSALFGLVPYRENETGEEETRAVEAHQVHLVGGDPYFGRVEIEGQSFLVRERSPYKSEIDLEALDKNTLQGYANICGHVLAQTHARSDEDTGVMKGSAEQNILGTIQPEVFADDMVRFAHSAAKRVRQDYALFLADHALGAFNFVKEPEM